MNFALPGCRSNFSLLWGTAFPAQLAARGAQLDIPYLGLADNNNLYGVVDFVGACRDAGIQPLVGVRLTTDVGILHLIARNYAGYQNLCRLVSAYQMEGSVGVNRLQAHREHLTCLAPVEASPATLKEIFENDLYLSLTGREGRRAEQVAQEFDIQPVADPPVSFITPGDHPLHLLLRAIDSGSLAANLNGVPRDGADCFFPDIAIMRQRFRHWPQAISNGLRLAEKCQVSFPEHKNLLPEYPGYDGDKGALLREKALAGLQRKKPGTSGRYQARLDFELAVIHRTGYTDYFLVVSGIVDHCRRLGIPAVGRGSAAGSLVAYALDITQVDPITEGLYFERFLNEARSDPPDIDLDIDWRRRDDVLAYIYDRYGHDRTAMIASYTRFRARLAVREVAKARGLSPHELNRLAKRLPHVNPSEIVGAVDALPRRTRERIGLERYRPLLEEAARLDNFPRHLGIHPGGVVITPTPLTDYVALERATKGIVVTQCDMYQAEKLGLVKIDILGQRGLAVIADCLEYVRSEEGSDFSVPDNDPAAYRLLQSGKTIGVFQIESPGLRALLRDLRPKELNDLTLALALIRPGASDSGMKKIFLDRHHGKEKTAYPDPRLEKILGETHGVFIYQEQVLLCSRAIAGFNLPAADLLRRAITKDRHGGKYRALTRQFLAGAVANGVPVAKATDIFKLVSLFAGFGFCKAHAATYGYLAYQSVWFKTHYPLRFMQAVLNNGGGYYPASVYIAEARRLGAEIIPPDVNHSRSDDAVIGKRLYVGLGAVKGIDSATVDRIIQQRPYASFDDFLAKVPLSEAEAENLIKAGAFDAVVENPSRLLWRLRLRGKALTRRINRSDDSSEPVAAGDDADMFAGQLIVPGARFLPPLPPVTPLERFRYEQEILGFSAGRHPLTLFPDYDGRPASSLFASTSHGDGPVSIRAWLVDIKRIKTREKKESMVFMTFEDLDDTFEVVLFPDVYRQYAEIIREYRYFEVTGTVQVEGGTTTIIADALAPAPTGLPEQPYL